MAKLLSLICFFILISTICQKGADGANDLYYQCISCLNRGPGIVFDYSPTTQYTHCGYLHFSRDGVIQFTNTERCGIFLGNGGNVYPPRPVYPMGGQTMSKFQQCLICVQNGRHFQINLINPNDFMCVNYPSRPPSFQIPFIGIRIPLSSGGQYAFLSNPGQCNRIQETNRQLLVYRAGPGRLP